MGMPSDLTRACQESTAAASSTTTVNIADLSPPGRKLPSVAFTKPRVEVAVKEYSRTQAGVGSGTTARSLSELQDQLDRNIFYRANRKYIVNANYIQVFSVANSSRIRLKLAQPVNEPIMISQQNTRLFKQWMGEKL